MIIHGKGGTGKSRVIQTITEHFKTQGAAHLLIKAAYTGVAASIIDGKTTHVIAQVSRKSKAGMSNDSKGKLQSFWRYFIYLIIDEISMIGKSFFAMLSRHIGIGRAKPGKPESDLSFGGINVILCGNFHQFPPVAVGPSEALYYLMNTLKDSTEAQLERTIYEEFDTVVILRQQVRCKDLIWDAFLKRLRMGEVREADLRLLRSLVITSADCPPTDFSCAPWSECHLVTPRHAVRRLWNDAAIRKHCSESGQRLFICSANDKIKKKALTMRERYAVAGHQFADDGTRKRKTQDLPHTVEIAVGMRVMVTSNLETDLDITNGARGVITDIVLDPEEPPLPDTSITKLIYLPSYILVKLDDERAGRASRNKTGIFAAFSKNGTEYEAMSCQARKFNFNITITSNLPSLFIHVLPTLQGRVHRGHPCGGLDGDLHLSLSAHQRRREPPPRLTRHRHRSTGPSGSTRHFHYQPQLLDRG